MRARWLAIWLVIGMCGIPALVEAHVAGGPAQVQALLAEFPNGGPALRAAVARAVEANAALAEDVVSVAAQATAAQQRAIGAGLGDAATYFGNTETSSGRAAQAMVEAAIQSAPPGVLGGFALASGPSLMQVIPGFNGPALTTNNCVSPSSPASCP